MSPPPPPTLRPYQTRGEDETLRQFAAKKRAVCVVAPTGSGKTVLISDITRRHRAHPRGGRVLIVVHRTELLGQTVRKLQAAGLDHVGVIAAGKDEHHDAPVLVASVQTLLSRAELPDGVTLLILDEAHHYVAAEWRAIADRYRGAYVIGFTATPERSDGSPLGDIFEGLVVVAQVPELIDLGHLCPIDVVAPDRQTDGLCADPVDAWRQHGRGRPTVMFCRGVEEARQIADTISADGTPARAIWGDMPAESRQAALDGFVSGEISVLTNVFVLTEGWDAPNAEVCILARGCGHVGTYLQMVGRVLRPSPSKARALLVDLVGAVHVHGYPDELRQYSLDGRAISGAAPTKDCPECAMEWPLSARTCDPQKGGCGYQFSMRGPRFDLAPLTRMTREQREEKAFLFYLRLARSRGWKDGFAIHKFEERFGRAPWAMWRKYCKKTVAA